MVQPSAVDRPTASFGRMAAPTPRTSSTMRLKSATESARERRTLRWLWESLTEITKLSLCTPAAMPRSAPLRFGIRAVTVRPGIPRARSQTSDASTNCGISFGGTNEQTSISGMPAAASASSQASFSAVGMNWLTFCKPSRMPTSQTWTSMRSLMEGLLDVSRLYRSAPLELRLALLVEGPDALLAILGADHAIIGLDLEAEGG